MNTRYQNSPLGAGLNDFFTAPLLITSLFPLFAVCIAVITLFTFSYDSLQSLINSTADEGLRSVQAWFEGALGTHGIISAIFHSRYLASLSVFIVYTGLAFVAFYASIAVSLCLLGLITPLIVRTVIRRHYPAFASDSFGNIATSLLYMAVVVAFCTLLLVICLPLYLIPVVGFFLFHFITYLLFKKLLLRDIASNITSKDSYKKIKAVNRGSLHGYALLFYLIATIPLVGLFAQVFFVAALSHFFIRQAIRLKQLGTTDYLLQS
ncbi:EI24 domain-containing protein [Motiliproteus sediminis]|uniref:EI24 domain-containing protein n=1 Tax=Motiliproteus sediminis TaxID=1468178 RepID=UPI001AEF679C|nr:EI24 domain-containing protein [Motiliproteus sediminis]